mgnify:FL=1
MGRQFVAGILHGSVPARSGAVGLFLELGDLLRQSVDLLLLAKNRQVELIEQVFGVAGLDLELVEARADACLLYTSPSPRD